MAYEIIVVNDGSTDGGGELVAKLYGDKVSLIDQKNQGVSVARNTGIAKAKFDYIAFLDADDYWHPQYLENMCHGISQFPEAGILGCSYAQKVKDLGDIDEKGWKPQKDYFKKAIVNTLFFTSATVIKKEFFQKNQGFDANLARGEDLDVWFRSIIYFGNPVYNFSKWVFYSSEDKVQATKIDFPLEKSLVYKILTPNYGDNLAADKSTEFIKFKDLYVYFKLYPFLKSPANETKAKMLLKNINQQYFFLKLPYQVPYSIIRKILEYSSFNDFYRNYLKFCTRYLYKV